MREREKKKINQQDRRKICKEITTQSMRYNINELYVTTNYFL